MYCWCSGFTGLIRQSSLRPLQPHSLSILLSDQKSELQICQSQLIQPCLASMKKLWSFWIDVWRWRVLEISWEAQHSSPEYVSCQIVFQIRLILLSQEWDMSCMMRNAVQIQIAPENFRSSHLFIICFTPVLPRWVDTELIHSSSNWLQKLESLMTAEVLQSSTHQRFVLKIGYSVRSWGGHCSFEASCPPEPSRSVKNETDKHQNVKVTRMIDQLRIRFPNESSQRKISVSDSERHRYARPNAQTNQR